jgi:hypothetical protein
MTWILFLLCIAIAGRELYLAFDRRRPAIPGLDGLRNRLAALEGLREELEGVREELEGVREELEGVREELERQRSIQDERLERLASTQVKQVESLGGTDARISSLVGQINDRVLPELNARLTRQREDIDRLDQEVTRLREHLVQRLDQAVATSLGADPVDTVAGALGSATEPSPDLAGAYDRLATQFGMRVELTAPASYRMPGTDHARQTRYFLSGASPRALERDFINLLGLLRRPPEEDDIRLDAAESLLDALRRLDHGGAQIGPLVIVRTPDTLVCGVLPLAELIKTEPAALVADPSATALRLDRLPRSRLHKVTH